MCAIPLRQVYHILTVVGLFPHDRASVCTNYFITNGDRVLYVVSNDCNLVFMWHEKLSGDHTYT